MKRNSEHLFSLAAALAALLWAAPARADLAADLGDLEAQAADLQASLQGVSGPAEGLCGGLVAVTQMSRALAAEATRIDEGLAAPLTLDASILEALERLSLASVGLAQEAARLSVDLELQQSVAEALTLRDAISAVLLLSADIGVMADRIGEMSDKILVMSDDIGTMADRILLTQQIQSDNLLLTQQTLLATQGNALALASVVEDASYGLSFEGLADQGEALAAELAAISLSPWSMARKLSDAAADVHALTAEVEALAGALAGGTTQDTIYSSVTALSQLADMSAMLAGLSAALDGYVIAISGLQAITSTPTLLDALKSVLALSADIGLMADRINEMADQILAMSDNIGAQADQLVLTQQTLSLSSASTQASVLMAQELAVALIAARTL